MLDDHLPVTLQYQLKSKLTARIASGEWARGDKISSEREICEEYGVSRMTVREALGDLERDGTLVRMRGKGTFVAKPKYKQELGAFYSFSEEIRKMGLVPRAQLLEFAIASCEEPVASKLGLLPGEAVHRIERLRFIGDDVFALEHSHVPYSIAPALTGEQVAEQGLYNSIRLHSGLAADSAEEEFEAVGCGEKAARLLALRPDAAVLRLTRLTRAGGTNIEYCESYVRGDQYKYKVILHSH